MAEAWQIRPINDIDLAFSIYEGVDAVADVYRGPKAEDRVRLIAAAPDLYTALEDFDNWFCGFNPDDQASRMEGRKVVIRARAALQKARGDQ